MIFPEFLKQGSTIGVTAPSHSINDEQGQARFKNAVKQLKKRGYETFFTNNVFSPGDAFGRSASAKVKAKEFNQLINSKNISAVYSASGGDFLAEMLEYVDLDLFRANPKWVQGYSDNTSLLFYLTTKADVATAYGANFGDFGMEVWQESVERGLNILEGRVTVQDSFEKYQDGFGERNSGLEGYDCNTKVNWEVIAEEGFMEGRLLGGCLDVLSNIAGTKFDGALDFAEKYKKDGIIWFLESFDLGFEQMMETLWKLKTLGWFENAKGFVFGRPLFYKAEDFSGNPLPSYKDVLLEQLSSFHVPIIMNADIGHKGPQFVMVNGARARVEAKDGKGKVAFVQ